METCLPVSTAALIVSSQLIFTAFFALILVWQKFTPYTVNTVVLLTIGAVVLALCGSSDKPQGESGKTYTLGFVMTFVAAVLSGLLFPAIELLYIKGRQAVTCTLVLEIQMVISFAATLFSTVGMFVVNDFKAIANEAREFQLGEAKYYVVLISGAIVWQVNTLGAVGIIFCASSLVTGIISSVLLPIQQVLAVVIFHDKFQAEKGLSLVLCLWGFVSHLYGEYKAAKKKKSDEVKESEMTPAAVP
ncbi:hypothetical protein M9H77_32131 [Catharanthus roseus]|uniref:Uncharacterized protein n=1 Tax=Catharanthus roseus TaxID=4058 RepID=A0ACC0A432_CATRO|nr:hypothetical protein M9H77_32131 [Catharanthus roseus]